MTLPPPPYVVTAIQGQVEQDAHGNSSAFITVEPGGDCLLRMKGVFPHVGDTITDRVLSLEKSKAGNEYLKLVKPSQNGSRGGSQAASQDGPGEAYWAGQNAAKGRSAAQDRAIAAFATGFRHPFNVNAQPNQSRDVEVLTPLIDWFYDDVQAAQRRAVEGAGRSAAPPAASTGAGQQAGSRPEPTQAVTSSDRSPSEKQTAFMVDLARQRGLDGPGMKQVLRSLGVEQFSQLDRNGCVDKWKAALAQPVATGGSDLPEPDPWPADEPTPELDPEDRVPF